MLRYGLTLIALATLCSGCISGTPDGSNRTDESATTRKQIDKSPQIQADRKKLIETLTGEGVFSEVVRNGTTMPRAWVTPRFLSLDFKEKQDVVSVVYAFYFAEMNQQNSVALINSKTGKEIGRFFGETGLKLD